MELLLADEAIRQIDGKLAELILVDEESNQIWRGFILAGS